MEFDAPIVLASASPRRRAFLAGAGLDPRVAPVDIDETPRRGEAADAFVTRMAAEKSAAARAPGQWTLTSDTVVVRDGEVLNKPADPKEAAAMLGSLSGRAHTVLTAWVLDGPTRHDGVARADVRFRSLTPAEIADYVATGAPLGFAGGYGIQGAAGDFVAAVEGDYDAVVGLPVGDVLAALEAAGAVRFRSPIERRAAAVRGRMAAATQGALRADDSVRLVAVCKGHPAAAAEAAWAAGLTDLGENYAQPMRDKAQAIAAPIRWHFIGGVQRNKAAIIAAHAALVHGVDSARVAAALAHHATDGPLPVLLQVNLYGEASKGGVAPADLPGLLAAARAEAGLAVRGLMTIPPPGTFAASRRAFGALAALRDTLPEPASLPELSMGMSGDFAPAIAMGATLIRVGTAIFGERPRPAR